VVNRRRREVRAHYLRTLARHCPGITVQAGGADGVYPILVVALPHGVSAQQVQKALTGQGIHTRQWYCPTLDRHPAFADFGGLPLGVAHDLSERLLGLPFFIDIAPAQIDRTCRALAGLLAEEG
jgi:dTDP-4-amino-4,6-dideoxygalactose transaminase